MNGEPWSDDRLATAYRARFGAAAPVGLVGGVVEAVRSGRPPRVSALSGPRFAWLASAAVVALLVIGSVAVLSLGGLPRPPETPAAAWPDTVAGLPVIGVEEAIARPDADPEMAIAVAGYYGPIGGSPVGCPAPATEPSPIELRCPDQFSWLMRDPEQLVTHEGNTWSGRPPTGPALNPIIRLPVAWDLGRDAGFELAPPVPVIVIGHFDDHRSAFCPADQRDACRRAFVVDRLAWVDGDEVDPDPRIEVDTPTVTDAAVVATLAASAGGGGQVLSVGATTGSGIGEIEPAAVDEPRLATALIVWVVKRLDTTEGRPRVTTILLPDGTSDTYVVDRSGVTALGPAPTPSPSPTGGPRDFEIRLVDDGPLVRIRDDSGLLLAARGAQPDELERIGSLARPMSGAELSNPAGQTAVVLVQWYAWGCDWSYGLAIDAQARSIDLSHAAITDCRVPSGFRGVFLEFRESVPADEIEIAVREETVPTATATPAGQRFELPLVDPLGHHVTVEIKDESGLLVAARSAALDEPLPGGTDPGPNRAYVSNPSGRPTELRVTWTGSPCDTAWNLSIGPIARSISLSHPPRPGCDAVAVSRDLVVTFSEPIPAAEVVVVQLDTVIVD